MASHTLPVPLKQARKRVRVTPGVRAPSLRATLIVFVALLILFRWLHLMLALQTAATGRQIQIKRAQLSRIERENALLRERLTKATLPERLAAAAKQKGYGPVDVVYLPLAAPLEKHTAEPLPGSAPAGSNSGNVMETLDEILGLSTGAGSAP